MRQQSAAYFEQKEDEELQKAILLSRSAFGAGAGAGAAAAAAAAGAGTAVEPGNHGDDYEDQLVQEALRRSVTDTAAACTTRKGGDGEMWETLPLEALAGGGGDGGGSAAARAEGEGGGGGGGGGDGGGDVGVGVGTEHSPVCL